MCVISMFSEFSVEALAPCPECQHRPPPASLFCQAMSECIAPDAFIGGECPWFEKRGAAAPETKPVREV